MTREGVKQLVRQLNETHEGIDATMEIKDGLLILDIAGEPNRFETILEGIMYLRGVIRGLEIMKT